MSKNDIVVLDRPLSGSAAIQILAPRAEADEIAAMFNAHAKNDVNAFELIPPRIKIAPGGIGVFITDDGQKFDEITGVIALAQEKRGYWPNKNTTNKPPLCSSPEGRAGFLLDNYSKENDMLRDALTAFKPHTALSLYDNKQPIPEKFSCDRCPLSKWGSEHQSGNGGRGKACKEMRRLIMVIDGFAEPVIFTLPPTSCKPFDQFASGIKSRGGEYFGVRVRVKQSTQQSRDGNRYGVAEFSLAGAITTIEEAEAVIAVREDYERLLNDLDVTADEYEHTEPEASTVEIDPDTQPEEKANVPF